MRRLAISWMLPVLVVLVGCSQGEPRPAAEEKAAPTAAGPPTLEELRHATYRGLEEPDGPITLVNGKWEGEPYEPGAASRPTVTLARDLRVLGDLDGDGAEEAVVLLAESSGGSGTWQHVAVVGRRQGALENVATTLLGDRVQVRDLRVENGRLLVDVLRAGADDAACCPGELTTLGFTLEADGLKTFDPGAEPTRLSLEAIGGKEWVLRSWARNDPAPAEPEVTLQYVDGRFAGRSACNRYLAPVKETGDSPGAIAVGMGPGTMMACPDPAGAMEVRFLRQLGDVSRFGFMAGELMLSYETDDGGGVMLFAGRPPGSETGS